MLAVHGYYDGTAFQPLEKNGSEAESARNYHKHG